MAAGRPRAAAHSPILIAITAAWGWLPVGSPTLAMDAGSICADYGSTPQLIGRLELGYGQSIALDGHYAHLISARSGYGYAASGIPHGRWYDVIDVAAPSAPVLLSSLMLGSEGGMTGLAAVGGYAYVASYFNGIWIVDVRDPTIPQVVSTIPLSFDVRQWAVAGDYLVATCDNGMFVVRISDPESPVIVGSLPILAGRLALEAGFAYLCGPPLRIVDLRDPANPVVVATAPTEQTRDVEVVADRAYVADGSHGLKILDVSNPAQPLLLGTNQEVSLERIHVRGRLAYGVSAESDHYVESTVSYNNVAVFDVALATAPQFLGFLPYLQDAFDVTSDGYALLVAGAGLEIIEGRPPPAALVGRLRLPNLGRGFAVTGTVGCVATWSDASYSGSLAVVDLASPTSPLMRGSVPFPGGQRPAAVATSQTRAYVVHSAGFTVVSVEDPDAPFLRATLPMPSGPSLRDVCMVAPELLAVAAFPWLRMVEVPADATPVEIQALEVPALAVASDAGFVYAACSQGGLQVIDATIPGGAYVTGGVGGASTFTAVATFGDRAYTLDPASVLHVFDIADPHSPTPLGSVLMPTLARGIAVQGRYLNVACERAGIYVVDARDPMSPAIVGGVGTPGMAEHPIVLDGRIALLDHNYVTILQRQCWTHATPIHAWGHGGHTTSLDGSSDVILELFGPQRVIGGMTPLAFSLARPATVTLSIYDVMGRQVALLVNASLSAGRYTREWRCVDGQGRHVVPGVYFARLDVDGHRATQKIVLR